MTYSLKPSGSVMNTKWIAGVSMVLVFCFAVTMLVKDSWIRDKVSQALTRTNGATVDIEMMDLSAISGKVSVRGIGMTNREDLSQNKIQIGQVCAPVICSVSACFMSMMRPISSRRCWPSGLVHARLWRSSTGPPMLI